MKSVVEEEADYRFLVRGLIIIACLIVGVIVLFVSNTVFPSDTISVVQTTNDSADAKLICQFDGIRLYRVVYNFTHIYVAVHDNSVTTKRNCGKYDMVVPTLETNNE